MQYVFHDEFAPAGAGAAGLHGEPIGNVAGRSAQSIARYALKGNGKKAAKWVKTNLLKDLGLTPTARFTQIMNLGRLVTRERIAGLYSGYGALREQVEGGGAVEASAAEGASEVLKVLQLAREAAAGNLAAEGQRFYLKYGNTQTGEERYMALSAASLQGLGGMMEGVIGGAEAYGEIVAENQSMDPEELNGSDAEQIFHLVDPQTIRVELFSKPVGGDVQEIPGAGFFTRCLGAEFPESLALIQVYKKEELANSLAGTDLGETDCLTNTLLVLGVLDQHLLDAMRKRIGGCRFPWIPSRELKRFAEEEKLNIMLARYTPMNRRFGSCSKSYFRGRSDSDTFLPIGKVGGHYVPDVDSGWTPAALNNLEKHLALEKQGLVSNLVGRNEEERLQLLKDNGGSYRKQNGKYHIRPSKIGSSGRKYLTYGEVLAFLLWEHFEEEERTIGGRRRRVGQSGRHSSHGRYGVVREGGEYLGEDDLMSAKVGPGGHSKFLELMEVDDQIMLSEMYMFFVDHLEKRLIPMDMDEDRFAALVKKSTKEVEDRSERKYLNVGGAGGAINNVTNYGRRVDLSGGRGKVPGRDNCSFKLFEEEFGKHGTFTKGGLVDKFSKNLLVLTKDEEGKSKVAKMSVLKDYTMVAFDFETTTDGDNHVAYLCACSYYVCGEGDGSEGVDGQREGLPFSYRRMKKISEELPKDYGAVKKHQVFYGPNCAGEMMDFILEKIYCFVDVLLVAHNLRYDLNQLVRCSRVRIQEGIFKSTGSCNCATILVSHSSHAAKKYQDVEMQLLDSLQLASGMKLKDLGETYRLDVAKEIFPYGFYSQAGYFAKESNYFPLTCERVPFATMVEHFGSPVSEEMKDAFREALGRSTLPFTWHPEDGTVNPVLYAAYYCSVDCEVLLEAFTMHRQALASIRLIGEGGEEGDTCELDCFSCVSLPQFATEVLRASGCLDGVYQLSGLLRSYTQQAVFGGKVGSEGNLPLAVMVEEEDSIADFDACSLYPTAMWTISELGGFPTGVPKRWKDGMNLRDPGLTYYVVTVEVVKGPAVPLNFPILPKDTATGGRHYTNDWRPGDLLTANRVTLLDAMEHQGMEFKVLCGVYWNEGGNGRIGMLMEYFYTARVKAKQEGKQALQLLLKLLMNSMYGRMIMRPNTVQDVFLHSAEEINNFIQKYPMSTVEVNYLCSEPGNERAVIKQAKSAYTHWSMPHLGALILSVSKFLMHRVMVLAETMGIRIYYQDTDSMHISARDLNRLGESFWKKYGKPLIAVSKDVLKERQLFPWEVAEERMGLFHSDFEGKKGYTEPHSVTLVVCGKKIYADVLEMESLDGSGEVLRADHFRMKGISREAVEDAAGRMGVSVMEMYLLICCGESVHMNLLAGGKVSFEFGKNFVVASRKEFFRTIRISEQDRDRALQERYRLMFVPAAKILLVRLGVLGEGDILGEDTIAVLVCTLEDYIQSYFDRLIRFVEKCSGTVKDILSRRGSAWTMKNPEYLNVKIWTLEELMPWAFHPETCLPPAAGLVETLRSFYGNHHC